MHNAQARDAIERVWKNGVACEPIRRIPRRPRVISEDQLSASLRATGLASKAAKHIADTIAHLREVANWYEDQEDYGDVGEHETRTLLIVPLIMSLGWAEKNVKIEWHHTDVALFDAPYPEQTAPVVIIESKQLWHGLGDVQEQAKSYAKEYPRCDRLVVSDGIRYKLFTKPKRGRKFVLSACMNLLALTRKHPYERGVKGAPFFLRKLMPKVGI